MVDLEKLNEWRMRQTRDLRYPEIACPFCSGPISLGMELSENCPACGRSLIAPALAGYRKRQYIFAGMAVVMGAVGLTSFIMFFNDAQIYKAFGDLGLMVARVGSAAIAALGFRGAWSFFRRGSSPTKRRKYIEAGCYYSTHAETGLSANYLVAGLALAPSNHEFFHKPPGGARGEEFHSQAISAMTAWQGAVASIPATGEMIRTLLFLDLSLHYLCNCDNIDRQYHPELGNSIRSLARDGPVFQELAGVLGPMLGADSRVTLTNLVNDSAPEFAKALEVCRGSGNTGERAHA